MDNYRYTAFLEYRTDRYDIFLRFFPVSLRNTSQISNLSFGRLALARQGPLTCNILFLVRGNPWRLSVKGQECRQPTFFTQHIQYHTIQDTSVLDTICWYNIYIVLVQYIVQDTGTTYSYKMQEQNENEWTTRIASYRRKAQQHRHDV